MTTRGGSEMWRLRTQNRNKNHNSHNNQINNWSNAFFKYLKCWLWCSKVKEKKKVSLISVGPGEKVNGTAAYLITTELSAPNMTQSWSCSYTLFPPSPGTYLDSNQLAECELSNSNPECKAPYPWAYIIQSWLQVGVRNAWFAPKLL